MSNQKSKLASAAASKREQYYEKLAQSIMGILDKEEGEQKWSREWKPNGLTVIPTNAFTGHQYSGGNMMALLASEMLKGYSCGLCVTSGQLRKLSKEVEQYVGPSKGERGNMILIPVMNNKPKKTTDETDVEVKASDENSSETRSKGRMFFKVGSVFFLDQLTSESQVIVKEQLNIVPVDQDIVRQNSDHVLTRFAEAMGVKVMFGYNRPAYSPSKDMIVMPDITQFNSKDEFASTIAHEGYHATGHKSRDGRFERHGMDRGLKGKAMEECRAELYSLMVGHLMNLTDKAKQNSSNYIKHWAEVAKEDPKKFVTEVMGEITPVFEAVLSFINDKQPKVSWFPEKSSWPLEPASLPNNDLPQQVLPTSIFDTFDELEEILDDIDTQTDGNNTFDDLDDLDDLGSVVSFGERQPMFSPGGC